MRFRPALLLLSASLLLAAQGQDLVEPVTGISFPATRSFPDGSRNRLSAAAVALRHRDGFRFYTLCLYVDLAALRRRVESTDRDPEALARHLVSGEIGCAFVTHFYSGVAGRRRMDFLRENITRTWPEFSPDQPELQDFLRFIQGDLKRGDTTEIWLDPKGQLLGRHGGRDPVRARSASFARAFVATYFGSRAMDEGLKHELLAGVSRALR